MKHIKIGKSNKEKKKGNLKDSKRSKRIGKTKKETMKDKAKMITIKLNDP